MTLERIPRILLTLLFSIWFGGEAYCAPTPLRVGAILPLTNNDYASVGREFNRGLMIAQNELGDKVALTIEDDQGEGRLTVTAAHKLINIDRVDLLLLAEYVQVQPAGPVAEKAKIPTLVFWESSPEIESVGEFILGIGYWQPSAGEVPARYASSKLGLKRASIIYDSTPWSDNVVKYFKREFSKLGGEIVSESALLKGAVDFRSEILKLRSTKSDFIFAPISEHPATFFNQLKASGYKKPVLTSDQVSEELIAAAAGGFEDVMYSNAENTLSPEIESLAKKYTERFKEMPMNMNSVSLTYDALRFSVSAWDGRGKNEYLINLKRKADFIGALGPIAINEKGSYPRPEVMFQVKDGVPIRLVD